MCCCSTKDKVIVLVAQVYGIINIEKWHFFVYKHREECIRWVIITLTHWVIWHHRLLLLHLKKMVVEDLGVRTSQVVVVVGVHTTFARLPGKGQTRPCVTLYYVVLAVVRHLLLASLPYPLLLDHNSGCLGLNYVDPPAPPDSMAV